ncbi:hypothetical protein GMA12_06920 [Kocuria sediminis]|uniref:Uncharacterized protein n=1 Tax=Kocuria sediminis TaxID=1038857 RepID=A0A6N8GPY1_9MICC|nr:hypothetical protein [Kocuria sediminis]MUN62874.1 hypothetical protein [Kocuria sediminis]
MRDDENMEELADDIGEIGDAKEHIDLTPKQEMTPRRTMESIQRSLAPTAKLQTFTISDSTLKNIAAISRVAETQQATVASAMKPLLDVQSAWHKQFVVINSDIFKSLDLTQASLNLVASQLTGNTDFGIAQSAAKFAAHQTTWLKGIGPAIAAMHAAFYPPNLRSIESLQFEEVEQIVMVDGIPLYGLPRAATAEALIRADGASKRRDILGRRWKTISADCRTAVEGCTSGAVAPYISFAVAALDALDAGHTEAAQALAGSLVDAILNSYFGKNRTKYTPDRKGKRTKDAYDEFSVRQFIAFAPLWQTYQQFFVTDGDKVPTTFSRNATAHTVSPRQFSRRNALQGLMVACSLLYRLDEEAAIAESDESTMADGASESR